MPQDGWRSYFIIWEQRDWESLTSADAKSVIYDFISASLRGASDPITPTRIHANPSPVKQIPNMVNAEGDITLHHHPEHMLPFWKHLLMAPPVSTPFVPVIVRAIATYTTPLSLTTQPAAASCDPGLLTFAFYDDAIRTTPVVKTGTITVSGTDQNGTAITETLTLTAEATKETTKYFQTVNANGVVLVGITSDFLEISGDRNTSSHIFALLGDNTYVDEANDKHGLAIELVKGTIPNLYEGCLLNTGTLTLADTMQLTLSILARTANYREAFDGSGTATDVSGYSEMVDTAYPYGDEIYPGWGASITLNPDGGGAVQTNVESVSFSMSNNLGYPKRSRNSRLPVKPVRPGDRDISLTCTIDYDTVANGGVNWDSNFFGNVPIAVVLSLVSTPYAGPELTYQLTLPRCQLITQPDPEITTPADLLQTLTFRPLRSVGSATSNEASLIIKSTETAV